MIRNGDGQTCITKVAFYARVSSEEQRENQTIQTQLETSKKWLELQELTGRSYGVHEYYQDDGVSGTIALADRPAGARRIIASKVLDFIPPVSPAWTRTVMRRIVALDDRSYGVPVGWNCTAFGRADM